MKKLTKSEVQHELVKCDKITLTTNGSVVYNELDEDKTTLMIMSASGQINYGVWHEYKYRDKFDYCCFDSGLNGENVYIEELSYDDQIRFIKLVCDYFMNDKMNFSQTLQLHKKTVSDLMNELKTSIDYLSLVHDNDKIENKEIFDICEEHFVKLKSIPFGTKEYKDYEDKYLSKSRYLHNQKAHHFHSNEYENNIDIDLPVIGEVICDIVASSMQYSNDDFKSEEYLDKITDIIYNKPRMSDYVTRLFIRNTVKNILRCYHE